MTRSRSLHREAIDERNRVAHIDGSRVLSRCSLVIILLIARAAVAGSVVPEPTKLPRTVSLDAALELLRTHGLDLLIADAATENAEGQVLVNGAVPNPQVALSIGNAFTYSTSAASQRNCLQNGASCSPWSNSLSVLDSAAIEDSLSGKRELRRRVARSGLAAAKLSRKDAERTLAYQVKSAYAQVAQAQLALKFAKEVAATNIEMLKKFRDLARLGARGEGDLERIEVQKLEADNAVDQAEGALQSARLQLAFLLGVRGAAPEFEVDASALDYKVPADLTAPDEIALLRVAFAHRPDLISLGYSKQSAEAQIELVRRQRFPDVTLGATYAWGGFGGFSTNGPIQGQTLSLQLSVPLPVFYHLEGEARQAKAQYDTSALQEAKATAQVAEDIQSALATLAAAKKLVERMEGPRREGGGLLESARGAYTHTAQTYYAGTSSLTDFLDAYRTWIATQDEYYGDLASYWTAVYQLEAAVGRDLR
jgi:cobalt-zinc-cadmium efflux system outer membrane protein